MPAQVSQSVLPDFDAQMMQEMNLHAHDPLRGGFSDLPPGVTGVAKLTKCKFELASKETTRKKADGSSAAGSPQLVLVGVAMEPEFAFDPRTKTMVRVAGQQVRPIPILICDLKRGDNISTWREQVLRAMNDMKLVANRQDLFPKTANSVVLEQTASAMETRSNGGQPMYYQFTTEASDDGNMVFVNVRQWQLPMPPSAYVPPVPGNAAVQDDPSRRQPPTQTQQPPPTQTFNAGQTQAQSQAPTTPSPQTVAPTPDPLASAPPVDINHLVKVASGDERAQETRTAQKQLMEIWKASGRDEQAFRDAPTYEYIGQQLSTPPVATNGSIKKDDTWKYKMQYTDPLGDVQTMTIDAVVTAVNSDGTYDLTDLKTRTKAFRNVKKEELVAA